MREVSHYTLVQCGDPARGECVNVGIIAWRGDEVACRVLADWSRVRALFPEMPLEEFAARIREVAALPQEEMEKEIARSPGPYTWLWFRAPYPALLSPEQTANDAASFLLVGRVVALERG